MVINALNNSEIICANSNYSKDEFIKMGVNKNKIIKLNVPPNFVIHTEDKKLLESFRKKFVDPSKIIVLFCGRLVERKGVEYLIKAMNNVKQNNVHLIVVGGGELLHELNELTNSLNLKNRVTIYGRASEKELGLFHDISDIFVCPSIVDSNGITEYLGLVIPEAMESGLPVIATSVGGIIDTLKNEKNGLIVPPNNPEAIAKAIQRIIFDGELKRKIVENSKLTVKEFAPSTIAQKYYEIFKKIVT